MGKKSGKFDNAYRSFTSSIDQTLACLSVCFENVYDFLNYS